MCVCVFSDIQHSFCTTIYQWLREFSYVVECNKSCLCTLSASEMIPCVCML